MDVGVVEGGQDGQSGGIDRAVGRRQRRGVEVGAAAVPDEDAGPAAVQLHVLEQDAVGYVEGLVERMVAVQHAARELGELPSARGEHDAAAAAVEQASARFFLQLGDVLADGGLGNAQRPGRGSETAQPGHPVENTQSEILEHKQNLYRGKDSIFICT